MIDRISKMGKPKIPRKHFSKCLNRIPMSKACCSKGHFRLFKDHKHNYSITVEHYLSCDIDLILTAVSVKRHDPISNA